MENNTMNKDNILLRKETVSDYEAVENITREAFWNQHVPGCDEHYLVHIMRNAKAFIKELDFVAVVDGTIVGNIMYTKSKVVDDKDVKHQVITFGPVSVLPSHQCKGIGHMLIEHTMKLAKELGYNAIITYGDPDYYKKYGFNGAKSYDIGTADNLYADPLIAVELYDGALDNISGRFFEDEVFNIDEAAVKEFDSKYPPKELKNDLPTQVRFRELIEMNEPRK